MQRIILIVMITCLMQLFLACSSNLGIISIEPLVKIPKKPVQEWTTEDCNKVLNSYTTHNSEGFAKLKGTSLNNVQVYIKAITLNEHTIKARVRNEAIIRRYPEEDFKQRLQ